MVRNNLNLSSFRQVAFKSLLDDVRILVQLIFRTRENYDFVGKKEAQYSVDQSLC
jgi:uncharacterized protein with GYD domain